MKQRKGMVHSALLNLFAGCLDEGVASYLKALSVCESYASAHYNLGVVYSEMGLVRFLF